MCGAVMTECLDVVHLDWHAARRRWSGVDRAERARRRAGAEATPPEDGDNPLPEAIDPITLEPVVCVEALRRCQRLWVALPCVVVCSGLQPGFLSFPCTAHYKILWKECFETATCRALLVQLL